MKNQDRKSTMQRTRQKFNVSTQKWIVLFCVAINQYLGCNQAAADSSSLTTINVTSVSAIVGNAPESRYIEIVGSGLTELSHHGLYTTNSSTHCEGGEKGLELVKFSDHMVLAILPPKVAAATHDQDWVYLCAGKKSLASQRHLGTNARFHR